MGSKRFAKGDRIEDLVRKVDNTLGGELGRTGHDGAHKRETRRVDESTVEADIGARDFGVLRLSNLIADDPRTEWSTARESAP